jgi:hypothetical protein
LVLSMEDPSTIRRAEADIGGAPYGGDSLAGQTDGKDGSGIAGTPADGNNVPYLFSVRNMFFLETRVLSVFEPRCPSLKLAVS